jgi:hypothetical protein
MKAVPASEMPYNLSITKMIDESSEHNNFMMKKKPLHGITSQRAILAKQSSGGLKLSSPNCCGYTCFPKVGWESR